MCFVASAASAQAVAPDAIEQCLRRSGSVPVIVECITAKARGAAESCEDRLAQAVRNQPKALLPDPTTYCTALLNSTLAAERERAQKEREASIQKAAGSISQETIAAAVAEERERSRKERDAAVRQATTNATRTNTEAVEREKQRAANDAIARANQDFKETLRKEQIKTAQAAEGALREAAQRKLEKRRQAGKNIDDFIRTLRVAVSEHNPLLRANFDAYSGVLILQFRTTPPLIVPLASMRKIYAVRHDATGTYGLATLCSGPSGTKCTFVLQTSDMTQHESLMLFTGVSENAATSLEKLAAEALSAYEDR